MIFTSLNAVTAVGPGVSQDLGKIVDAATMVVSYTGIGFGSAALEVSMDGTAFAQVARVGFGSSDGNRHTEVTIATAVGGYLFKFVRANFDQFTGSAATVTAKIAAELIT